MSERRLPRMRATEEARQGVQPGSRCGVLVGALTCALSLLSPGCDGNPTGEAADAIAAERGAPAAAPATPVKPPFPVRGDGEGLLLTWFDGDGPHTAQRRADIPEAHRAQVRIASLTADPSHRLDPESVYVADLRRPGPDGSYPVVQMARAHFDALVDAAHAQAAPATPATAGGGEVIVYSAAWCGVCKQAKRFLRAQNIPFVDKDIEKDPAAAAELRQKAAAAGVRPRGVPVIDVGGELMLGFDQARLLQLLGR